MAELTNIYRAVNVLVTADELQDLKQSTGTYGNMDNYYEIDAGTFQEFNVSIPYNIGQELYNRIGYLIDKDKIDYIRFYNDEV